MASADATNGSVRCVYSDALKALPPLRGVMSPMRPMTEDDFRTLHDWGAQLLRYQMNRNWGARNADRDLDDYDRWLGGKLDHLESFVLPMAEKYGMKVVIDLHMPPGGKGEGDETNMFHEPDYAAHFIKVWERIAKRFRGHTAVYGYDLVNEPVQKRPPANGMDCWTLQRKTAERIREIDPDTPIVVESNLAASPYAFPAKPFDLKDIIYQVHVYIPVEYTHQGVFGPNDAPKKWPDPSRGWERDFCIRDRILKPVRDFQLKYGARIYAGEFSAICWAEGADRFLADCISLFEEFGWDWTYHAFREWLGWSVEHEGPDKDHLVSSADNPRKRVLLDGFKRRSEELDVILPCPSALPSGASLEGDVLTVTVPPEAAGKGCAVGIPLDPKVFTKWPFRLEMDVWAEGVSPKPNPWNGVKMMLQAESVLGEVLNPQAEFPTGTVSRTRAAVSFDFLGTLTERVSLVLGLEQVSGTAHFDLSSFRAREIRKFPKTNETYRVSYPDRLAKLPQLRGVMLPAPENIREADFDRLAEWGVTLVRFQMTGGKKDGWFAWVEKEMAILDKVLAWAEKRGILVCVDLHSVPGGRVWPRDEHRIFVEPGYADLLVDIWERFARRYKGDLRIYGFDLINEPIQRNSDVVIGCWELQDRMARAIRAIDPERTIVMEANYDDSHNGIAIQSPLALDNVIYEFHMYQPLAYTHQYVIGVTAQDVREKGLKFKPKPYPNAAWQNPDLSTTGRPFDKEYLRRAVRGAREFQLRHNARIYVGEFSVAAWAPGAERYLADCADLFAEYGWDWTYHAFREYEAWSVEHDFPIPPVFGGKGVSSEDNQRKRALLDAIGRISEF